MLEVKKVRNKNGFIQYDVYLTRGDSAYITLEVNGIEPTSEDIVRCQVRDVPTTGDLIIDGEIIREDSEFIWYIRPQDTNELTPGEYYWDAEIEVVESDDVFTFVPVSKFVLLDESTLPQDTQEEVDG